MFNNVAIDVFLGLTFVFLLYSLLATILQEAIAGFINLRAAVLVKAIRVMLNDRKPLNIQTTNPVGRLLIRFSESLKNQWKFISCNLPDHSFAKAFYKHPSIKYLSASSIRSKPSYINPANFSSTIVKMLRGRFYDKSVPEMVAIYQKLHDTPDNQLPIVTVGAVDPVMAQIQPETLDQLRQIYVDAEQDINKFKTLLENWYNDTMDRAIGWYKRLTTRILFIIGFCLALWGNVDTFKIYHILATNQTAREQMVQMAIQSQHKYANLPETADTFDVQKARFDSAAYATVQNDVNKANSILGIGRITKQDSVDYKKLLIAKHATGQQIDSIKFKQNQPNSPLLNPLRRQLKDLNLQFKQQQENMHFKEVDWSSFFGWIVMAFAITLGAPFWFDLLNKFINLRSAGAKPAASDDDDTQTVTKSSNAATQPVNVIVNSNAAAEGAVG